MDQLVPDTDDARRPWHLKQLKWTLQSLAQAGSVQPTLFPEQTPNADDLAFSFDHWTSIVRQNYGAELSADQNAALDAIARKLATMSRDGAEFDADLWTEAALATSEHWADVRRLASSALNAFEWVVNASSEDLDDEAAQS
jgi:hypothetical protein